MDCNCLVERVVDRIRSLGSRKLSYPGRVMLIKAVLQTLHSYWARIFILPKTVIGRIEAICRAYLWHGSDHKEIPALVSWKQICHSKNHGGLVLKDLHVWNLATIGKYAWWIAQKKDHLWVRWVNAICIKSTDWMAYKPRKGSSWAWRKICQVKDIIRDYLFTWDGLEKYNIKESYLRLKPDGMKVHWYPWMLNRWILPKYSFTCWLIAHQRLLTQDRLIRMKIAHSNCCFLCGSQEENHPHLFFDCLYSKKCLHMIANWCKVRLPDSNYIQWQVDWRQAAACRKKVTAMILACLMYHVWQIRNISRMDGYVWRPEVLFNRVKYEVKSRLYHCDIRSKNVNVINWIEYLKKH
ncbi:uncharacterized protein LOC141632216 [Silene latifolia]|uniref:uncharacterized protein LOC141632216 n=1 Tax=Silene latifolia TaxID=37657 RepID=UPI003D778DB9